MENDNTAETQNKKNIKDFFSGKAYPAIMILIAFISHSSGSEMVFGLIYILLSAIALFYSDSIKPFIITASTLQCILSVENTPGAPTFSSYLFEKQNFTMLLATFALLVIAVIKVTVKNAKSASKDHTLPLVTPSIILAAAFLVNGFLSDTADKQNFIHGAVQIVFVILLFYVFYVGLKNEDPDELISYFVYISALSAILLIAQTMNIFASIEGVINDSGSIIKDKIQYGWGGCNNGAQSMVVLIPVLFLGVMKKRHWRSYFFLAFLTLVSVMLTLSRNALIFSVTFFVICSVLSCFFGDKKKEMRIIVPIFAVIVLFSTLVFYQDLIKIFKDFLDRKLNDSGRYPLWQIGFDYFREYPLFGKGFLSFGANTGISSDKNLLPYMLHNTFFTVIGAMGLFGICAYVYYRIKTLKPFFNKPTLEKTMIGLSILTMLGQSLLDNFIFNIIPMFYTSVALAIAFLAYGKQSEEKLIDW